MSYEKPSTLRFMKHSLPFIFSCRLVSLYVIMAHLICGCRGVVPQAAPSSLFSCLNRNHWLVLIQHVYNSACLLHAFMWPDEESGRVYCDRRSSFVVWFPDEQTKSVILACGLTSITSHGLLSYVSAACAQSIMMTYTATWAMLYLVRRTEITWGWLYLSC